MAFLDQLIELFQQEIVNSDFKFKLSKNEGDGILSIVEKGKKSCVDQQKHQAAMDFMESFCDFVETNVFPEGLSVKKLVAECLMVREALPAPKLAIHAEIVTALIEEYRSKLNIARV